MRTESIEHGYMTYISEETAVNEPMYMSDAVSQAYDRQRAIDIQEERYADHMSEVWNEDVTNPSYDRVYGLTVEQYAYGQGAAYAWAFNDHSGYTVDAGAFADYWMKESQKDSRRSIQRTFDEWRTEG